MNSDMRHHGTSGRMPHQRHGREVQFGDHRSDGLRPVRDGHSDEIPTRRTAVPRGSIRITLAP